MSDHVLGTCCAVLVAVCLDVVNGICIDFASVRESSVSVVLPLRNPAVEHSCTETLCCCPCGYRRSDPPIDESEHERSPLLLHTQLPTSQPPMHSSSR